MRACINNLLNRIKVSFYIFIAISAIHYLTVSTVAGGVKETNSIQATQFWSEFSERFLYSVRKESVLTNK